MGLFGDGEGMEIGNDGDFDRWVGDLRVIEKKMWIYGDSKETVCDRFLNARLHARRNGGVSNSWIALYLWV
jgi:hypothetical protein